MPAMICAFDLAKPVTKWPTKHTTWPVIKNQRRPSMSVLDPASMNAVVMEMIHAGMNHALSPGFPRSVATSVPTAAKKGTGMNERP
jgi:hypothetical protein